KSMKSDIMALVELLKIDEWRRGSGLTSAEALFLIRQCESFLRNVTRLRYDRRPRIPVLVDWNIGNFSITRPGFRFFSRWDYDWFRIEPRHVDFYFCSRVVSQTGDRTNFSYLVDP